MAWKERELNWSLFCQLRVYPVSWNHLQLCDSRCHWSNGTSQEGRFGSSFCQIRFTYPQRGLAHQMTSLFTRLLVITHIISLVTYRPWSAMAPPLTNGSYELNLPSLRLRSNHKRAAVFWAEDYNLLWTDTPVLLPVCRASGGNRDKCTVQVEATHVQHASPPARFTGRVDVTGLFHLQTPPRAGFHAKQSPPAEIPLRWSLPN